MRTAPSVVSGEVEDLVPFRGPLTGEDVELVVAVDVDLVGRGPDLLPLLQLVGDVESPAAATKVGNQSSPEKMPFWTLPAGTLPGQRTIAGTRKPPSITVPLPPAKGVWPPSGQVKFSAPLSVLKARIVSFSRPISFSFFITPPTTSSSCAMPASWIDQPFSEFRMLSYLSERCVTTCMRV